MTTLIWLLQTTLLALISQPRPTEAQPKLLKKSGAIVFPDDNLCLDSSRGGINDFTYCNQVRNYPSQSELNIILRREFSNLEYYIYEDVLLMPNITQRIDGVIDIELCRSREKIVYPQGGYTQDNTWMMILNDNKTFKQGVRVEECITDGEMCNVVTLPNHYTAKCEQKYNLRTMWALRNNQTRVMESFRMPSCCQCVVKSGK